MENNSALQLLRTKRFLPFFITQFLGAFNDNLYKQALITLITFGTLSHYSSNTLNNIGAALFILPFFLLSAFAGQLADKYPKHTLIANIKLAEVFIMVAAATAMYLQSLEALLVILFLMGSQSAFFGPVKYSIIPQHLKEQELIGGNALVEMGTFMAIILGYIFGVVLTKDHFPSWVIGAVLISISLFGWLSSRQIPTAPAPQPSLKISLNLFSQSWKMVQYARKEHAVFLSIMGISWFWFLGAAYITQLPVFSRDYLTGTADLYVLLLTLFSVGIAAGSMLCEKLSGRKVELGLVPLGSLGLSLFGIDLYFAYGAYNPTSEAIGISAFLQQQGSSRIVLDISGLGLFGGLYIVPLFALVQQRSDETVRSQIIAGNNILNALFMVASALTGIGLIGFAGLSVPEFFLVLALMNIAVTCFIYQQVPEFTMRFLIWVLTHTLYRVTHSDLDNIPKEGPCVLVCNHVSYADALIIGGACRRPVRFVMFKPIYQLPVLNFIFRTGKSIPIDSKSNDPIAYENAFDQIAEELNTGEVVCIFPEGKLTTDGEVDEFKRGIEKILQRTPVTVVPMALKGLWGSVFSHKDGAALTKPPRRFWSKTELVAGQPVSPQNSSAENLYQQVLQLRGEYR